MANREEQMAALEALAKKLELNFLQKKNLRKWHVVVQLLLKRCGAAA